MTADDLQPLHLGKLRSVSARMVIDDVQLTYAGGTLLDHPMMADARRALADAIERQVLAHDPATRICVHGETMTAEQDWATYQRTVTVRRNIHLIDPDPIRNDMHFHVGLARRSGRAGTHDMGGLIEQRTAPYICHGCRQRRAAKPDEDCAPCLANYKIKALMGEVARFGAGVEQCFELGPGSLFTAPAGGNGAVDRQWLGHAQPGSVSYTLDDMCEAYRAFAAQQYYRASTPIVGPNTAAMLRNITAT